MVQFKWDLENDASTSHVTVTGYGLSAVTANDGPIPKALVAFRQARETGHHGPVLTHFTERYIWSINNYARILS